MEKISFDATVLRKLLDTEVLYLYSETYISRLTCNMKLQ